MVVLVPPLKTALGLGSTGLEATALVVGLLVGLTTGAALDSGFIFASVVLLTASSPFSSALIFALDGSGLLVAGAVLTSSSFTEGLPGIVGAIAPIPVSEFPRFTSIPSPIIGGGI